MFISIGIISSPPFIIDIIMGSIGLAPCWVVVVPDIIIINGKIFEISSSPLKKSIYICCIWLTVSAKQKQWEKTGGSFSGHTSLGHHDQRQHQ